MKQRIETLNEQIQSLAQQQSDWQGSVNSSV
jgi:hypothetical protein